MKKAREDKKQLRIVEAIIEGRLSAADASTGGVEPQWQTIYQIAERLGQLDRGKAVTFNADQAAMLHALIDSSVTRLLSRTKVTTVKDAIAEGLTDLAFDLDDPFNWVCNLGNAMSCDTPQVVMTVRIDLGPSAE